MADAFGETVTDAQRIASLLQQLRTRRAAIAVQLGGEAASTLLLDVAPASGTLVLDALFPPSAQARLESGSVLGFNSRIDGIAVRGALRVERIEPHPDGALIHVGVPASLNWAQRRAAFRVGVEGALPAGQVLHAGERHRAQFVDLSVLGLAARLTGEIPLSGGTHMTCEMNLPGGQVITGIEVRSTTRGPGHVRIGARYLELTQRQRALLEATTANLQRTALKRTRAG